MSNIKHKIFVGFSEGNSPNVTPIETFFIKLESNAFLLLENNNKILKENG